MANPENAHADTHARMVPIKSMMKASKATDPIDLVLLRPSIRMRPISVARFSTSAPNRPISATADTAAIRITMKSAIVERTASWLEAPEISFEVVTAVTPGHCSIMLFATLDASVSSETFTIMQDIESLASACSQMDFKYGLCVAMLRAESMLMKIVSSILVPVASSVPVI